MTDILKAAQPRAGETLFNARKGGYFALNIRPKVQKDPDEWKRKMRKTDLVTKELFKSTCLYLEESLGGSKEC